MTNTEIFICVKCDKFNWASAFLFLTGLCVFSKMQNIARIMFNKISCRKQISDARAVKSLDEDHYHMAKRQNSFTRFTSQIKIYFGCGVLLLKIPDRNANKLGIEPTVMPPMGSWYAEITDLSPAIELKAFVKALCKKNLRCQSKGI